jgi:uncharacterized protein YjbI with pentapeptide repeats
MYTIMNLCRYRNVFGAPGEGVHSYRFLNIAVIDVVFTFVANLTGADLHDVNLERANLTGC